MAAAINTNIKEHFYDRQVQFIALRQNLNMKKKEDREMAREQQRAINKAAPGPTTDSSLPTLIKTSVPYDLEACPEHFLWPMFTMNTLLESKQKHTFRLVPLTQGFVPGACLHICTLALSSRSLASLIHASPPTTKRSTDGSRPSRRPRKWKRQQLTLWRPQKRLPTPHKLRRLPRPQLRRQWRRKRLL